MLLCFFSVSMDQQPGEWFPVDIAAQLIEQLLFPSLASQVNTALPGCLVRSPPPGLLPPLGGVRSTPQRNVAEQVYPIHGDSLSSQNRDAHSTTNSCGCFKNADLGSLPFSF